MDLFSLTEETSPGRAVVDGVEITAGSRVRLHPRPGGDIMDLALAGRVAYIEAIEQDFEDNIYVAVTVEDDPGRDLGDARQPGHRFFFSLMEVEPLDGGEPQGDIDTGSARDRRGASLGGITGSAGVSPVPVHDGGDPFQVLETDRRNEGR